MTLFALTVFQFLVGVGWEGGGVRSDLKREIPSFGS